MQLDRNGFEVLDRAECLRLLTTVSICRLGVTMSALPTILPVNFALDGELLVIRSAVGTKLDLALHNTVIAVEADDFDPEEGEGWSVLVRGRSFELTNPDDLARADELHLPWWSSDRSDRYIGVHTETVTGRRIVSR